MYDIFTIFSLSRKRVQHSNISKIFDDEPIFAKVRAQKGKQMKRLSTIEFKTFLQWDQHEPGLSRTKEKGLSKDLS